jgi:alpha-tubulin suppressor-like RCC1 family protein
MCWGYNSDTGVGFGNIEPVWTPTRLGTDTWTAVAGSSFFSEACAIRGGKPYCWGDNGFGELGIGNTVTPQLNPVAVNVPNGTQWTEIAISDHTCAIASDATLWCWGANNVGQLGTGTLTNPITAPSAPLAGAWLHVTVAAYGAGSMTCGIKTDHTLWCWGQDQPPAMTQHLVPTQVGSDASWMSLSSAATNNGTGSGATTCAVKMNGTLWCWGMWLGDGTLNSSATPVQVGTASDWKTATVGGEVCAIKTGGTLWCWGNQDFLGDSKVAYNPLTGSLVPATIPTQLGSDTDWSTVITGGNGGGTSCATKTDGSLWCWGSGAAPIPGFVATPTPIN